jgi:tetratricopeptide (TPR) repeat protein
MRTCLQNVLDLNPGNQQAQQGLAWIDSRYGSPAQPTPALQSPPVEPPPPAIERAVAAPTPSVTPPRETRPSRTTTTTNLASEAALSALAAAARPTKPAAPLAEPIAAALPENPCPYCGAPTTLAQKACTQCRGDLMVRATPPDKRSLPLTILGGLWIANGVLTIIGSLLGAIGVLLLFQQGQTPIRQVNPQASAPFPIETLIPVVIGLLFGVGFIQLARALLRRQRWAYYTIIGLTALGLVGTLLNLFQVGGMVRALAIPGALQVPQTNQGLIERIVAVASVAVFCAVIFQALYLLLVALSYRDFFGPLVRYNPAVEPADHIEHYNNGIVYKNRGMWYMAAQEWEAAIGKKPREANYLHALGLAYAQLKRFDQARITLDSAIQAAPNNQQIAESRALIDQMAAKK